MKRSIPFLILILFSFVTLFAQPKEGFANAHPNIKLRDGNATGSNYSPTDVDPAIKNRWEKNNVSDIVMGGKYPRKVYNPNKGNRFGYDVYKGVTSSANKQGLRIEKLNGKDHLAFDGWAVINGYYHHDRHNQVTYIGAVNVKNPSERKIYKAKMTNLNAYDDMKWNFGSGENKCPNSGSGAFQKYSSECNMEYKWVGFKAYLPLDELFPKNGKENEWELYIIKGVKGHGSLPSGKHIGGARYVRSPLVMPSHLEKRSWSGQGADVVVRSGTELRYLTMVTSNVYRRIAPRSSIGSNHFIEHNDYRYLIQDENTGVATWLGVRSPHDNNQTRYASSMYWDFGGNIATVSLERTHYDIGIEHKDAISGEVLLKEKPKSYKRGTRTFNSKPRGHFKTPEGYEYVPMDTSKSVKVDKDKTITFNYKASLPNPSRIVEQGGGKNTHGKATGEAEWKLAKDDKPEELPDPNSDDFEWRNVTGGVEITKYIGNNKNVNIPTKLGGKNVVSIGENAFASKGLTGVTLPNTVVKIGKGAFKSNNIGTINIPQDVGVIEDEAFMSNQITSIALPDGVESVGKRAFFGNAINKLSVGAFLESIGELAFANNQISELDFNHSNIRYIENSAFLNNEVAKVVFNDKITRIGEYAFAGGVLTEVNIPENVIEVGSYAFANNIIENALIHNHLIKLGDGVFVSNQENPKDLTIFGYVPSTAKVYAEENNHTFKDLYDEYVYIDVTGGVEIVKYNGNDYDLNIPDKLGGKNVVSIGSDAFKDMAITSVKLPKTVHTIGEYAFADNQLTQVDLSNVKRIKSGAFTRNKIKNVTFNSQLEELAEFAFRSNKLTNVTIPDGITVIERYAFDDNELTNVNFPSVVFEIKERAFSDNKLKSFSAPGFLYWVGELAFWNNELTEVELLDFTQEIGARAFDSNNLSEIIIYNSQLEIGEQAFSGNQENAEDFIIRGHCESTASEYAENYGHTFTDLDGNSCNKYVLATDDDFEFVEDDNGYDVNGKKGYFKYIGDHEYVEIPHVIQGVEMTSYYNMFNNYEGSQLKGVKSTNTNITDIALMFANAKNITELDLSEFNTSNVRDMSAVFFSFDRYTLQSLDLSNWDTSNVKYMSSMFFGQNKLTELDLSSFNTSNVTHMGWMFYNARGLTELDLSNFDTSKVTDMGYMFAGASSLTELDLSSFNTSNVTNMSDMFYGASGLTELDLSSFDTSNVTNMRSMFEGASGLTKLDLSNFDTSKVTNMSYMFFYASSLTELDLSSFDTSNVTNMSSMFFGASSLAELDLSSFDTSNVWDMSNMFRGASSLTKGYARTQADADKFNASSGKPSGLTFVVKSGAFNNLGIKDTFLTIKDVDLNTSSVVGWFKDLFKTTVVHAQEKLDESMTQLINSFVSTGNHAGIRNIKHTIKVGNNTETDTKPFSIVVDPEQTKNKDMEYDFEYEYTNHIKRTYKCTDKKGNDCFAWKLDKTEPAWEEPYVKKFKLSDTNGEFERYTTSRLGRVNNANVKVYSSLNDNVGKNAGSSMVGNTYYIKEKAIKGNEVRYLLAGSPSRTNDLIGWVNELDLITHTHYQMDSNTKEFELTGAGKAYRTVWGDTKQEATNLRSHKGKKFIVNKTETVGDNIWYRGKINGTGNDIWVHQNHTTSNEIIKINETSEQKLNNVNNNNVNYALKMEHRHGEDVTFDKNSSNEIELLVGKSANHSERVVTTKEYKETIEVDRRDTKLESQTWKEIKHTFKYSSDYNNPFHVIDGEKYNYTHDIDENLRNKYRNNTKFSYADYAIPLRVSNEKNNELEFKTRDNFFITKKTGFQFSLPHHEVSTLVIREEAKKQYENYTGKTYGDSVISDPFDASRYYFNIDLASKQKPKTKYSDNVVIGKLGLSDITVHLIQDIEFENYLAGHYKDKPVLVEQKTSVVRDIDYTHEVILSPEQMDELRNIQKNRDIVIHSFRKADDAEIIERVDGVTP